MCISKRGIYYVAFPGLLVHLTFSHEQLALGSNLNKSGLQGNCQHFIFSE